MAAQVSSCLSALLLACIFLCHSTHAVILLALSTPTHCVYTHGNDGIEAICSGADVRSIPATLSPYLRKLKLVNTSLAVLQNGELAHLPRLVYLDLSGNKLTRMEPDSLRRLPVLRHLNIANNLLCFDGDAFPEDLFLGMKSLRSLTMQSNYCPTGHVRYPDKALGELTGLENLTMNGLPNIPLGPGFSRMTSLKTLVISSKHCHLAVVSSTTFESLENTSLSHMSLRACDISQLHVDALVPLSRLATLNLACNHRVGFEEAFNAIKESSSSRLDTVVLDDVSKTSVVLNTKLFASRRFESVRRLSVRANEIIAFDVRSIYFLPELREIATGFNLIFNRHAFFPTDSWLDMLSNASASMKLDILDASHLVLNRSMYRRQFCEPDHVDTEDFFREKPRLPGVDYMPPSTPADSTQVRNGAVPVSLQALFFDHAGYRKVHHSLPKVNITDNTNVVVVNLSYTSLTKLKSKIVGYKNLQVLDARNCHIYRIYKGALLGLSRLKYLFLQHNVIGRKGDGINDEFHGLYSLRHLDLSDNLIPSIEKDAFRDLTNIRTLNLHGNRLILIGFSVSHMASLVSLDISSNLAVYGDSAFVDEGTFWGDQMKEMNLTNNSFVCNCSSAVFVRWVQTTSVTLVDKMDLQCVNESDHEVFIATVDSQLLYTHCPHKKNFVVIIACVCSLLVVIAIAIGLMCSRRRSDDRGSYRRFKAKVPM
ncbi:hypothetical protein LSAT2_000635 [Lamellibrachia satsuma]|nr:hypothetical protein LSAT2_000635 [Lamellibrachia satsuma]